MHIYDLFCTQTSYYKEVLPRWGYYFPPDSIFCTWGNSVSSLNYNFACQSLTGFNLRYQLSHTKSLMALVHHISRTISLPCSTTTTLLIRAGPPTGAVLQMYKINNSPYIYILHCGPHCVEWLVRWEQEGSHSTGIP